MRYPRYLNVLILVSGLLLLLPSLGAARSGGGGCGGNCGCSAGGGETDVETRASGKSCRQGGSHGQGKAAAKGQGGHQARGEGGGGGGHGNHAKMEGARTLVHNHELIEREIEDIPGGVRTVTTSKDPEMVIVLREHVADMKGILESGGRVRRWDPLFVELFDHADEIEMRIKQLENGLEVEETSENPRVAELIRAHARKVSEFVDEGPEAAHRTTPVPDTEASSD